ncbi:unnamed protein product [Tuber aestivum]|uniref:Uncharacterized protein n=1 Tax=Tuber aestivum TaxID=59557 RepID=A0A292Q7U4_9PEZI|nr:unnamed protein product [Tuber aestivum]
MPCQVNKRSAASLNFSILGSSLLLRIACKLQPPPVNRGSVSSLVPGRAGIRKGKEKQAKRKKKRKKNLRRFPRMILWGMAAAIYTYLSRSSGQMETCRRENRVPIHLCKDWIGLDGESSQPVFFTIAPVFFSSLLRRARFGFSFSERAGGDD